MEENKLVAVKYYDNVIDAEVDMDVLKKNDIQCIYNDDTLVGVFPIFDDKERGLELMVFDKDLDRAKHILEEFHRIEDAM